NQALPRRESRNSLLPSELPRRQASPPSFPAAFSTPADDSSAVRVSPSPLLRGEGRGEESFYWFSRRRVLGQPAPANSNPSTSGARRSRPANPDSLDPQKDSGDSTDVQVVLDAQAQALAQAEAAAERARDARFSAL